MADYLNPQDLANAKVDAKTLGEAVNDKKVVKPRYGDSYKSIPMLSADGESSIAELNKAIKIALAAGAGESGWVASLVADESGKNQQQINNDRIRTVESVADMLAIKNPKNGNVVSVQGVRGGNFIFDGGLISENDNGVVFNGWVRQYVGEVYAEWFGADPTGLTDTSPIVETAMIKYKSLSFGDGEFLFSSVCGLPMQDNYSKQMRVIKGNGATQFNFPASSIPIFTSAAAKLNPSSIDDIFTAKYTISGINFFGLIGGACIFNLDRLYNIYIKDNNFKGIDVVGLSSQPIGDRGETYAQSVFFLDNHFADCNNIVKGVRAYNMTFNDNMVERCGDAFVFKHPSQDCGLLSFRAKDNLFESSGVFLQCDSIASATISGNYFEQNYSGSMAAVKSVIRIAKKEVGSYSLGLNISENLFDQKSTDPDYSDIYLDGFNYLVNQPSIISLSTSSVFGNRTTSARLLNQFAYVYQHSNSSYNFIDVNRLDYNNSPFGAVESKVHFWRQTLNYVKDDIVSYPDGTIKIGAIDTALMLQYFQISNINTATLDIKLDFQNADNVTLGVAALKLELMLFNTMGHIESAFQDVAPLQINATASVSSFMQSPTTAVIDATRSAFFVEFFDKNPTVMLVRDGSKYNMFLTNFKKSNVSAVYYGTFSLLTSSITAQVYMNSRTLSQKGSGGTRLRFVH